MRVGARGCRASQRFRVWWNRSILPWVSGVARVAVLLADAEVREQVLEAVAAADQPGGVHGPVVGERGGGPAVRVARCGEGRDHVVAAHPPEHRAPQQVAGVVVEPARDLDLAAVGQSPVGEVRLPDLVGRGRLEPNPGAPWTLVRLGHDEAHGVERPADGRDRRHRQAFPPEVPGDRHRSRVKATGGQLPTEGDDPVADRVRRVARVGKGSAGTWARERPARRRGSGGAGE